jgi:hypothetical protein
MFGSNRFGKKVGDTFLATMIRITIWVTIEMLTDRYISHTTDGLKSRSRPKTSGNTLDAEVTKSRVSF